MTDKPKHLRYGNAFRIPFDGKKITVTPAGPHGSGFVELCVVSGATAEKKIICTVSWFESTAKEASRSRTKKIAAAS